MRAVVICDPVLLFSVSLVRGISVSLDFVHVFFFSASLFFCVQFSHFFLCLVWFGLERGSETQVPFGLLVNAFSAAH